MSAGLTSMWSRLCWVMMAGHGAFEGLLQKPILQAPLRGEHRKPARVRRRHGDLAHLAGRRLDLPRRNHYHRVRFLGDYALRLVPSCLQNRGRWNHSKNQSWKFPRLGWRFDHSLRQCRRNCRWIHSARRRRRRHPAVLRRSHRRRSRHRRLSCRRPCQKRPAGHCQFRNLDQRENWA
jgi:hypothetical protein